MIKKILSTALWLILIGGIAWAIAWANKSFYTQHHQGMQVSMASMGPQSLMNAGDIESRLQKTADSALLSPALGELPADSIEKLLSMDEHLSKVSTYVGLDGKVYVNTTARQMSLRVFDQKGNSFYISDDARVVNPSVGCSQRCLVVSGHLPGISKEDKLAILQNKKELPELYQELLDFGKTLAKDKFLNALIGQVYVSADSSLTLSPRMGVNSIIFGKLSNTESKLQKLKDFYANSHDKVDWQAYKALNLKYKNQVVCVRK